MATSDEVDAAALASALSPKKVQQGNDILEQHPIADLLALSDHLDKKADQAAAIVPGFGMRFTRVIGTPGGGG